MAYCAIADLVKAFTEEKLIQLTDDTGIGAYDSAVLNEEIANAQEEIDPYCRRRYADSMPFTTAPGLLKSISVDIAIYRIHKRRGRIPGDIKAAYDAAVKKLEGISRGLIDLGTSSGIVVEDEDSVSFTDKTPEDRIFREPEGY
jgi:phage gp36-like protein